MNISLKQLALFRAIAHHDTMGDAAETMFLTKPALSIALNELETQLGHKVFDRIKNRLVINEMGKELLPLADELLLRHDTLTHLFDKNPLSGTLKIGASRTIGNHSMPALLRQFQDKTGHKDQTLFIGNSDTVCAKLCNFELTLGFIEGNSQHPELISLPWQEDKMVVIAHPNNPLTKQQEVTLSQLEERQWITRELGSGTRDYFLNHIAAPLNHHWHTAFEVNSNQAIVNFVAADLGLACLSKQVAAHALKAKQVSALKLKLPNRTYWLVYHKDKYQTPLIKKFITLCKE